MTRPDPRVTGRETGRSAVRSFYGRHAALYDAVATVPPVGRWRARAAGALDLDPGETAVEMGCGTGANLPYLAERVGTDGRVVGVDLTRPLLDRARRRVERAGWGGVALVHGDATRPPVAGADAVLATFVLGLLDDPAAAVERWCDLVGSGGRVASLEATRSDRLVGAALNPAFDLFVRLGAPSGGSDTDDAAVRRRRPDRRGVGDRSTGGESTGTGRHARVDAGRSLESRVTAGHRALVARTVDLRHESFGLGFLDLVVGTVE